MSGFLIHEIKKAGFSDPRSEDLKPSEKRSETGTHRGTQIGVAHGTVRLHLDGKRIELGKGKMYKIPPGKKYTLETSGSGAQIVRGVKHLL